jgi:hypothetical protein
LVLEHLAKITAIDQATAGRASDEMLARRRIAEAIPKISGAGDTEFRGHGRCSACPPAQ